MDSSDIPRGAAQNLSAPPYYPGLFSDRKHPRSDSGHSEDDFKNMVDSVQQNSQRNPLLDSLQHTFPNEPQKIALFELKDLPDHVILSWIGMVRSGSVGPVNDLSATGELSDSLYADSPYSRSSLGQHTLSRDRSGYLDGLNMYSSEPGTIDTLLQPYPTQARSTLSGASSYEPAMSHTISDHPGQFATDIQPDSRSQAARPVDAKQNISVTLTDDRRSNSMSVEAPPVHATSQGRSHSKDRVQWSCTLCEHDTFRGKQEWIRHERNQHFPRHVYYCHPDIEVRNKELYCVACKIANPGCTHIAKRDAHVCALKDLSARLFFSKEKFIKHLRSHDLPSDCRQLDEWRRPLPEQVWGCGFCVKVFDNVEERLFHISRHFERGKTRADWDPSRVLLSLLTLPCVANEWVLRVNVELRVEYYGQTWPELSWSKEDATALQRRVTSGRECQRRKQQFALG